MTRMMLVLGVALAGLVATAEAAKLATLKSGPQAGDKVPGPFEPLNLTGDSAGEKACLYCRYGTQPVAMVFARESTPATTTLLQKIDAACEAHKGSDLASFAVFLTDATVMNDKLKAMAKDHKFQHVVICSDAPAGPTDYQISKDAEVTVVLYKDRTVAVNKAFRKGELNEDGIKAIMAELPKLAGKK